MTTEIAAGRELDVLIATEVMGWIQHKGPMWRRMIMAFRRGELPLGPWAGYETAAD